MKKIEVECAACDGTGLYSGMFESKGEAVICVCCAGTGKEIFKYKPFVKRKTMRGIHSIRFSRGLFIGTGVGPVGKSMTYQEFLNDKRFQP